MTLNRKLILELVWILPSIAIPVALLVAIVLTGFGMHITVPGDEGTINAEEIDTTAPFDAPGVTELEDDSVQVAMIAQTFFFDPPEVTVPVDTEVEFVLTSRDVLHGFHLEHTNINMMIIPGRIARASATFEEPGEYRFVCHEYCGAGHHSMFGTVIVEEQS